MQFEYEEEIRKLKQYINFQENTRRDIGKYKREEETNIKKTIKDLYNYFTNDNNSQNIVCENVIWQNCKYGNIRTSKPNSMKRYRSETLLHPK